MIGGISGMSGGYGVKTMSGASARMPAAGKMANLFNQIIRDPFRPDVASATLFLCEGALATSGDCERGFEIGERRFSHILNPLKGWPVEGLASISVAASSCLATGLAASIAMLEGEGAGEYLASIGFENLTIDHDGRLGGSIAAKILSSAT